MSLTQGTETILNPLQKSALNKKSLCDYVVNVASGCLHGCTFCYVPSTPSIRTRQADLIDQGVTDPQMDWGNYLFVREEVPSKLADKLSRQRSWHETPSGRGVVLLCSGTDPYQNKKVAKITRATIEVLLSHGKKVRILTRSPLWLNDLDLLVHPDVTVGMSIPYLADDLSKKIEPKSPAPSLRLKALSQGKEAGCRIYIAMAPTHPGMGYFEFIQYLKVFKRLDPEIIFWEPINARGTNGKRMLEAGLDFAKSVMTHKFWAQCFIQQWVAAERAAEDIGIIDLLHIWPDRELAKFVPQSILEYWWYRPTSEKWENIKTDVAFSSLCSRPKLQQQIEDKLANYQIL
jgi:DNA repair photolyase